MMDLQALTETNISFGTLDLPETKFKSFEEFIRIILDVLFYLGGPIFVLIIIIAGFMYIFSFSSPNLIEKGNRILKYGIIGISIILLTKLIQLLFEILF